jgi:hypothetical protein
LYILTFTFFRQQVKGQKVLDWMVACQYIHNHIEVLNNSPMLCINISHICGHTEESVNIFKPHNSNTT